MPLSPGTKLGHYELLSLLGQGGMGTVYRATDTKLGRDVAIKVLPDSFAADGDRLARFTREAQVLASLNHPNIAAIYGVEERALVMELVEGTQLAGPVTLDVALGYARQIAEALEAAHEKGIVHRDLKPANVMVTADGIVKVLDFGLAKAAEPTAGTASGANSPTLTMRATEVGLIMGTAGYMAPEQAAGKVVDKRADIWAFGVVLFELVTGKGLFTGETVSHTLAHVLTREIDLSQAPAAVRPLLGRCLDRDVKTRLRDIGEARVAIQKILLGPAEVEKKVPVRGRPWLPWVVAGVAVGAAAGTWLMRPAAAPPEVVEFRLESTPGGPTPTPFLSPDGKKIAFFQAADGARGIFLRSLDRAGAVMIPGTEQASVAMAWAPDGKKLAFLTTASGGGNYAKVMLASIETNTVSELTTLRKEGSLLQSFLAWGESGFLLVPGPAFGIDKVRESGGIPERALAMDEARGESSQLFPVWLPGGNRFLYQSLAKEKRGTYMASLDGGKPQYVGEALSQIGFTLSRDGKGRVGYVRQGQLLARPFDPASGMFTGDEVLVVAGVLEVAGDPRRRWSMANGRLAYRPRASTSPGLRWRSRDGVELGKVDGTRADTSTVRLSPDETRLAIGGNEAGAGISVLDLVRGGATRLSFGKGFEGYPVWSPDGLWIAYAASGPEKRRIYRRRADGTGKEETVLESDSEIRPLSWSPDGKWLLYAGGARMMWDQYFVPAGGGKPVPFLVDGFDKYDGRFSPDGKWIVYSSNESGRREVYVRPTPEAAGGDPKLTGKYAISGQGGSHGQWRKDGKELYYFATDGKIAAVSVAFTAGGVQVSKPVPFLDAPGGSSPIATYGASGDGKRFLTADQPVETPPAVVVLHWEARLQK